MKLSVAILFERSLEEYRWELLATAISCDGKSLAIAVEGAQIVFWDMQTLQRLRARTLPANVRVLAWSSDGEFLAALLENGTVWMGTDEGEEIGIVLTEEKAWTLAFLPGTSLLVIRLADGQLHLWDILPARLLLSKGWIGREVQSAADYPVYRPGFLAFSQSGELLTVEARTREKQLEIWRLVWENERWVFHPLRLLSSLPGNVYALQYRPGTSQVFASTGEAIWGWDAETGQQTAKISLSGVHHASFCFSPQCDRLAIADGKGVLHIWDFQKRRVVAQCDAHHEGWVASAPFSPISTCFWGYRDNGQQEVILTGGWLRWQQPAKASLPADQETTPLYWSTVKCWHIREKQYGIIEGQ